MTHVSICCSYSTFIIKKKLKSFNLIITNNAGLQNKPHVKIMLSMNLCNLSKNETSILIYGNKFFRHCSDQHCPYSLVNMSQLRHDETIIYLYSSNYGGSIEIYEDTFMGKYIIRIKPSICYDNEIH